MQNFRESLAKAKQCSKQRLDQQAFDCLISFYDQIATLSLSRLEELEFFSLLALSLGRLRGRLDDQIRNLCSQCSALLDQIPIEKREHALVNLNMTYFATCADEESEEISIQLLAVRKYIYGPNSLEVAITHCNMGRVYAHKNESKAADSFENCLSITQALIEEQSSADELIMWTHLKALTEMCTVLPVHQKEFIEHVERTLQFYSTNTSVEPDFYGEFLTRLARTLTHGAYYHKAEKVARIAVKVCSIRYGIKSVQTRRAAHNLALALVNLEREEAADLVAIKYLEQSSNPNIPSGYYALGFKKRLLKDTKTLPIPD